MGVSGKRQASVVLLELLVVVHHRPSSSVESWLPVVGDGIRRVDDRAQSEGCETWSFVNADMFPPPVNTLSVVIGACRVISEYSHFLAKLQAPANMLRAYIANILCGTDNNAAVRQLQMYHYFIPSHIKLPLTHHHNCKNTFMSFANDTFDHSQVTSHLSQVMFVPCITKRIQQHRVTRRKSLLSCSWWDVYYHVVQHQSCLKV